MEKKLFMGNSLGETHAFIVSLFHFLLATPKATSLFKKNFRILAPHMHTIFSFGSNSQEILKKWILDKI